MHSVFDNMQWCALACQASCCHHQSDYFDLKTFFIRELLSTSSNNWELWIPFIRERCWRTLIRGECGAKVFFWLIGTKMSVSKRSRRALKICPQPTQDPTSNRDCLENSAPGERLTFCQDSLLFSTKLAKPQRIYIFLSPKAEGSKGAKPTL